MASTNAARQARWRARQAEAQAEAEDARLAALGTILATLATLDRKVDNLARAVDNLARGGSKRYVTAGADSADSASLRNGGGRTRARAGETVPPAPYGGLGGTPRNDVTEDLAPELSTVLVGNGANSVGAIVDALGSRGVRVTSAQVAAALVTLQAQGRARREPGDGPRPDRWSMDAAIPIPPMDPPRQVVPAPSLHVTCQDYATHAHAHRWDPDLGAFRCHVCNPPHPAPDASTPHAPGAADPPPSPGGLTNGHA